MGGRGSSSIGSKNRMKKVENKINSAKNYNELKSVMETEYGVLLGKGTRATSLIELKTASNNIVEIAHEFGVSPKELSPTITASSSKSNWLARADLDDGVELNNMYFKDSKVLYDVYEKTVKDGFHPKGTTAKHITDHELGHRLESLMVKKLYAERTSQIKAWNNGLVSRSIVDKVTNKLYNNGKVNVTASQYKHDLIGKLSVYATTNFSETLAEAVADFRANGRKANVLSIEIVKEIKNILK